MASEKSEDAEIAIELLPIQDIPEEFIQDIPEEFKIGSYEKHQ